MRVRLKKRIGADGEIRTPTGVSPPPPQGGVSTSFTTSAKLSCYQPTILLEFLALAHHQLIHPLQAHQLQVHILLQQEHLAQVFR